MRASSVLSQMFESAQLGTAGKRSLDRLSRNSLTTSDAITGRSAQMPESTPLPKPEFLVGGKALIPS